MDKRAITGRDRIYDEMERCSLSASFRRPPWHLTAAGIKRKENGDGVRKKKDGETHAADMGAG